MSIATSKQSARVGGLLGRGIYDVVEVSRLVKRDPETIDRWSGGRVPLHRVSTKPLYVFLDLISLWVISELVDRNVPKSEISSGAQYLAEQLRTPYPFAHKALATAGGAFFGRFGEWIDVGKRGQMAFQTTIKKYLRPLEYGPDGLAAIWKPTNGVWINPEVQAGSPCIDGTRIPTAIVAALRDANEDPEDIAADYELDLEQVEEALAFERAA
ncbi:MAG: DUF433 domain-containing protein [Actinomycetota bacterium]